MDNILTMTDSYKFSHHKMYAPNTDYIGSYLESRGGEFQHTVFFGLQYIISKYLSGKVVTEEKIDEAEKLASWHFGDDSIFNREGWEYILHAHKGFLPVSIKAVAEGLIIPTGNVLMTIANTDPKVAWLTNHLETLLLQVWYPCTVATISQHQKQILQNGLEKSGTLEKLPFMLHDFGFRGSTSYESAGLGGAAHLINFCGTDNVAGMELLMEYYDAKTPGFSVPSAEHSTITSWGKDKEWRAYDNILNRFKKGIVSVVSDSWDIDNACSHIWGELLRSEIVDNPERTLVIRPDSGDPLNSMKKCLEILGNRFGYSINKKGYKVLPDYIRIIQGDGISYQSLPALIDGLLESKWSLDNVAFGSGGGLLQNCNRDTQKFAIKCSWAKINGKIIPVQKTPKDDPTKASKAGQLKLVMGDNNYETATRDDERADQLVEVFRNGEQLHYNTLETVRNLYNFNNNV